MTQATRAARLFCAAALAAAVAVPAHAIVTATAVGSTTTYFENFNGGSSFSGGAWLNDPFSSDDYLWLSVVGAAASYSFTVGAGASIKLDFDYAGPFKSDNGTVALYGPPDVLGDTPGGFVDFLFANPGGTSNADAHYTRTFTGLTAGTYTLTFAKGAGLNNSLKVDDVNIAITAVPEPATVAMLLVGLGVVGAAVRRQRAQH